jgi:hypothetical protein
MYSIRSLSGVPLMSFVNCVSAQDYWACVNSTETSPLPETVEVPTASAEEWEAKEHLLYGTVRESANTLYDPYLLWVSDGWKFRKALDHTSIEGMAGDQVDARGVVFVARYLGYRDEDWVSGYTGQGCAVLVDQRHPFRKKRLQVMVTRDPYVIAKYARVSGGFAIVASYGPLYREAAALARAGFNGLGSAQSTMTIPLPVWPSWLPMIPLPAKAYEWLERIIPGAEIPTKKELAESEKSETGSWVAPVVGAVVGISLLGILWIVSKRSR